MYSQPTSSLAGSSHVMYNTTPNVNVAPSFAAASSLSSPPNSNSNNVLLSGPLPGVVASLLRVWTIFLQAWQVVLPITGSAYLVIAVLSWFCVALAKALTASLAAFSTQQEATAHNHYTNTTTTNNNNINNTGYDNQQQQQQEYEYDSMLQSVMGLLVVEVLVEYAVFYAIMCLADGAVVRAVAELYAGQCPQFVAVLECAVRRLVPLMGVTFVLAALFLLPMYWMQLLMANKHAVMVVLLAALMIWLVIVTYFVYAIIMVEHGRFGACTSLPRSFYLATEHQCFIFTTLLVFGLTKALALAIVGGGKSSSSSAPSEMGYHHHRGFFGLLAILISFGVRVLFSCWGSILQAVLYLSVRSAKEGLNEGTLTTELFGNAVPEARALLV